MKACGIVAEYNPFHNGHIYQLQQAKAITGCDVIIAVMSGNFVQRGQPAIINKWERTKAALANGVDLVIELPFIGAVQAASQFARFAIDLLALAGISDLVFGSETGNMEELREISEMSFNVDNFRANMAQGYSYPKSYGMLADSYGPNDILAVAYLKELKHYPAITPHLVKRTSGYASADMNVTYPSAAAIRQAVCRHEDVSSATVMARQLENYPSPSWDSLYPYVRTLLLTHSRTDLGKIFLMDEGIENHLCQLAGCHNDYESFISAAVSRRYTKARIQRTLCHLAVQTSKQEVSSLPALDRIRPLGFTDTGRLYLKQLADRGVVIADHWTANIINYRSLEYRAGCVYSFNMNPAGRYQVERGEISGLYLKPFH